MKTGFDSLIKHKDIITLLSKLNELFPNFIVNDFWEGDLCAVGISDFGKNALIYISTFQKYRGKYYMEVEDISTNKKPKKTIIYQDMNFDELLKSIKTHFLIK